MPEPLYREQLDKNVNNTGCSHPGCNGKGEPLYLNARCCMKGTDTSYFDGIITVKCANCEKLVVKIKVASKEDSNGTKEMQDGKL